MVIVSIEQHKIIIGKRKFVISIKEGIDMFRCTVLLFWLLPLLFSCSTMEPSYSKIIMKHPQTLDFQYCEKGSNGYKSQEECVNAYQLKGYEIWGKR